MQSFWEKHRLLLVGCTVGAAISGSIIMLRSRVDADPPPKLMNQPVAEIAPVAVVPVNGGTATASDHTTAGASPTAATTPATAVEPTKGPLTGDCRIMFSTIPPTNASVTWGKKLLGKIAPKKPLVIVRPRDSGPLDVTVTAAGFLPVQTRAHTFADTHVQVKLTPPEQMPTLFGYRAPLDAGTPLLPADQGVLPPGELTTPVPR